VTADDKALTATQDIFGRDRFGSDRGDMGGIGTFSRENRTLYAGRVPTDRQGRDLEEAARRQFGEFGAIDYVRVACLSPSNAIANSPWHDFPASCQVLQGRNCLFVKFRSAAGHAGFLSALAPARLYPNLHQKARSWKNTSILNADLAAAQHSAAPRRRAYPTPGRARRPVRAVTMRHAAQRGP
jgi:hypothetical protein